jgi:putative salt-induced outer membrane protein YdiY
MKRFFATAVGVLAIFSGLAAADEVVLKNGDKLTGTVKSLADGKLTINTPEAGDVTVDDTQISTFSTDNPIALQLSDGTMTTSKVAASGDGEVAIGNALIGNQKLAIASIDTINAPPADWGGELKFGALLLRGNTYSDSVNFGLDLSRTTKQDKISFDAEYLYGRSKDHTTGVETTVANTWKGDLKYDYNFTPKLYGFAQAQASGDQLAFYDLRFVPSAGVGYRLVNKPDFTFTPEGGIAWVYQHFTNGTPEKHDFSLVLAYHLTKKFNEMVSLFHNFDYYPSVENGSNYLLDADLGIRADMTKHFFTEFKFAWGYDSTPAIGSSKNDLRYELNVGYKF